MGSLSGVMAWRGYKLAMGRWDEADHTDPLIVTKAWMRLTVRKEEVGDGSRRHRTRRISGTEVERQGRGAGGWNVEWRVEWRVAVVVVEVVVVVEGARVTMIIVRRNEVETFLLGRKGRVQSWDKTNYARGTGCCS